MSPSILAFSELFLLLTINERTKSYTILMVLISVPTRRELMCSIWKQCSGMYNRIIFLTQVYFFDTTSVNLFVVKDGVKKILMSSFALSRIYTSCQQKTTAFFMVLFSGTILTMRTKVGIAQQNYNVMEQAYNNYSWCETIRQDDAKITLYHSWHDVKNNIML